jgi:hypothetical protein
MFLQSFSAIALLAIALSVGFSMDARAQAPERICDKSKLPEIDFYTCEGIRLRNKGQMLLRQATLQISEGQRIVSDCKRLEGQEDKEAARDCNLLTTDTMEDAAFKRAEAADLLNQAERMESRAADMDKRTR